MSGDKEETFNFDVELSDEQFTHDALPGDTPIEAEEVPMPRIWLEDDAEKPLLHPVSAPAPLQTLPAADEQPSLPEAEEAEVAPAQPPQETPAKKSFFGLFSSRSSEQKKQRKQSQQHIRQQAKQARLQNKQKAQQAKQAQKAQAAQLKQEKKAAAQAQKEEAQRLKAEHQAAQQAQKEEAQRLKAEQQAAQQAQAAQLKAEQQAQQEEAQRLKAEQQAEQQAQAAQLNAEQQAPVPVIEDDSALTMSPSPPPVEDTVSAPLPHLPELNDPFSPPIEQPLIIHPEETEKVEEENKVDEKKDKKGLFSKSKKSEKKPKRRFGKDKRQKKTQAVPQTGVIKRTISEEELSLDEVERERQRREQKRLEKRRKEEQAREQKEQRQKQLSSLFGAPKRAWARMKENQQHSKEHRHEKKEQKREEKAQKRELKAQEKAAKAAEKKSKPGALSQLRSYKNRIKANRARKVGKDIVGLAIADSSIRVLHLREDQPLEVFEHPLSEGIVIDGLLQEPNELTAALKRLWKSSGLKSKKVNFSICNKLVTLNTWNVVAEHDEDVEQALAMMAGRVIAPMDPNESIIDYAELSRSGPQISLQIAAADKEMVTSYVKAVEKAGLLALSCEIGPLAATRAITIPRRPGKVQIIVDLGAELTTVMAASGPDVFYMRVIESGGNDFTEVVHRELNIPWTEAEMMKQQIGLKGEIGDYPPEQAAKARELMRSVADRLSQEILQTCRYFEDANRDVEISGFIAMGGGAKMNGLVEQIQVFSGLPQATAPQPRPDLVGAPDISLTAEAVGLAKGHSMSLLPDVSGRSFALTSPFRRKAKISIEEAESVAKRLAATRKKKKRSQALNPKMIGTLLLLVIVVGSYFAKTFLFQDPTTAEGVNLTQEAKQVQKPSLTYDDNTAKRVSDALLNSPNFAELQPALQAFLAGDEVVLTALATQGSQFVIAGTATSDQQIQAAKVRVQNSLGEGAQVIVQKGANDGASLTFSLLFDAMNDPNIVEETDDG